MGKITYMVSQTPGVWLDFQSYIKDGDLVLCWDSVDELFPEKMLDDMLNSLEEQLLRLTKYDDWIAKNDISNNYLKYREYKECNFNYNKHKSIYAPVAEKSRVDAINLTVTQNKIIAIWKKHLDMREISIYDNYFKIGGDSLKAMGIINEIKRVFKLENQISINLIFTNLTIEKISDKIDEILEDIEVYSI